jgi:hypothetical protein
MTEPQYVQGVSAVAERADIPGVMHERGNAWRRALVIGAMLGVIFLAVGAWFATRTEPVPPTTTMTPPKWLQNSTGK